MLASTSPSSIGAAGARGADEGAGAWNTGASVLAEAVADDAAIDATNEGGGLAVPKAFEDDRLAVDGPDIGSLRIKSVLLSSMRED